jgi:prepilin-type N-terminal cleavage/methylation domain-containing protein
MNKKGFTLIELLIYVSIFSIISMLFIAILTVSTKTHQDQLSANEVNTQLHFVTQRIQNLIRESSAIESVGVDNPETPLITEYGYIKLRMEDPTRDPTCISLLDLEGTGQGTLSLLEGPEEISELHPKFYCRIPRAEHRLTSNRVLVPFSPPGFSARKFSNAPGHDSVQINLTLAYIIKEGTEVEAPLTYQPRSMFTTISRVSAATFDSEIIPSTDNFLDIGIQGTRWKDLYVNNIDALGTIKQSGNFDGVLRGFFPIVKDGTQNVSCNTICQSHSLVCDPAFPPRIVATPGTISDCTALGTTATCYCK